MEPCPLLRELDAWFSLALDVLAGAPDVRRDVLLMVGTAGSPEEVAGVVRDDCVEVGDHVFVYPPAADGRALPLTSAFVEATGLTLVDWPEVRDDVEADTAAVVSAVGTIDAALRRITGIERREGVAWLRALRMHAWRHELGGHVDVLGRCYGAELTTLLDAAGPCPTLSIPQPRSAAARAPVA